MVCESANVISEHQHQKLEAKYFLDSVHEYVMLEFCDIYIYILYTDFILYFVTEQIHFGLKCVIHSIFHVQLGFVVGGVLPEFAVMGGAR